MRRKAHKELLSTQGEKVMPDNTGWKKITKEVNRRVLVTNNIGARDAIGQMSHVWAVDLVIKSSEPDKYGKFTSFTDSDRRLCGLTHYCEIPKP